MSARRGHRAVWNTVGVALFVVMVFPVFWMISTALKPDGEIYSVTPKWVPDHPTLRHFHDAVARPYFWNESRTRW